MRHLHLSTVLLLLAPLTAQQIPLQLTNNWNGIVHAGEAQLPDDPNGFRSISDRALDFSAGLPADPLLAGYQVTAMPGVLDLVHVGNRNTVDNGTKAFDATPDADFVGIQPNWLANPDQTGWQVSVLPFPLPVSATTQAAFLYQVSNGGGSFQVEFTFADSTTYTATLAAGDWFGGTFAGTQDVDQGNSGANLSLTEGRVDLASQAGKAIVQIAFGNRSNSNAGYAILAGNLEYLPPVRRINQIALNYNWNGIVHAGEDGQPDAANGFRSISDRALDFRAGLPGNPQLAPYRLVATAGVLDLVHLGNRNTVDGGLRPFDPVADGDDFGVQPAWLPVVDQSGPQTTLLADPILIDGGSRASLLFQISNGGGSFQVEFAFQTGSSVAFTVSGGDWFGGAYAGTAATDRGTAGANLSLTERTIDLSAQAGRILTAITFQNASNGNAGHAVVAMNVSGCLACTGGAAGLVQQLGGGNGPRMATASNGNLGCDLDWTVLNAQPNGFGFFALGLGTTAYPLASVVPGCLGTVHVPNPTAVLVTTGPAGSATIAIPAPVGQGLCGVQLSGQYLELATGTCYVSLSDAIAITIGN